MTESHFGRPESLADRQLADARRDPRLAHGREAVVADWWAAMGAAERVRTLADWGIHELVDSEVHEEQRVDASGHTDPAGPRRQAALEAARQRAGLARAERDNQLVEHNAMTLISMVGALDALVEELIPRARKMLVEHHARSLVDRVRAKDPDAVAHVGDANLEAIRRVVQALTEVVALRHVLAHRAGRVDARALKQAPSLRYADGDLVRVTHADYLLYSAALWTYGQEVIRRLIGNDAPAPPLSNWRQNYTLNA